MDPRVTVIEFLRSQEPGTALLDDVETPGRGKEAVLFIRERSSNIRRWGPNPLIEVRAGIEVINRVGVFACMVRVQRYDTVGLYETWLNYHSESGQQTANCLPHQPELLTVWIGDSGNSERGITLKHWKQGDYREMVDLIKMLPPWSMDDFDAARDIVCSKRPTPESLWEALGNPMLLTQAQTATHRILAELNKP